MFSISTGTEQVGLGSVKTCEIYSHKVEFKVETYSSMLVKKIEKYVTGGVCKLSQVVFKKLDVYR